MALGPCLSLHPHPLLTSPLVRGPILLIPRGKKIGDHLPAEERRRFSLSRAGETSSQDLKPRSRPRPVPLFPNDVTLMLPQYPIFQPVQSPNDARPVLKTVDLSARAAGCDAKFSGNRAAVI